MRIILMDEGRPDTHLFHPNCIEYSIYKFVTGRPVPHKIGSIILPVTMHPAKLEEFLNANL